MKEFRFAIGNPDSRRSSVWKVWTRKSDAYIQSRMMGSDTKVSLHESGLCQWSNTDVWVKKTGSKNSQRHNFRWNRNTPPPGVMIHAFRIIIPESELRTVNVREDFSNVVWIDPPPSGEALIVECLISPPSESPFMTSDSGEKVISLSLSNGCWFVLVFRYQIVNGNNAVTLRNGRQDLIRRATEAGVQLTPQHRAVLFVQSSENACGMIEFVPLD